MFYPLEGEGIPLKYVCCKCMVFGGDKQQAEIRLRSQATQIVMQMKIK